MFVSKQSLVSIDFHSMEKKNYTEVNGFSMLNHFGAVKGKNHCQNHSFTVTRDVKDHKVMLNLYT